MNELHKETSPYLLQHATNPIHWKAWSEKTLELAKKSNKLIAISIGYSTCHWCHVMEHESFEDNEVATLMNEHFISIKIDREEFPDIDAFYMKAVQIMTKQGGWPLNVVCLPDGRPIWGGTYFPKQTWLDSLSQLSELYQTKPETVIDFAEQLYEGISILSAGPIENTEIRFNLEVLIEKWSKSFDWENGGYGRAPKFMMPSNLLYLQKLGVYSHTKDILEYTDLTLTKMAWGGLFDTVEGGFSRYSVDMRWHVPHFEKMLYDNAQLLPVYADAYKRTKNSLYKEVITKTINYIENNWANKEGGYYSALDADSINQDNQLKEGAYYVWTDKELQDIIKKEYDIFKQVFNINDNGYWEENNYVLIQTQDLHSIAKQNNIEYSHLVTLKKEWEELLLQARKNRKAPRLDDKTLTSWNAMYISGLLNSYTALNNKEYLALAIKTFDFITSKLWDEDQGLYHTYKNGQKSIKAYLDDYAFYISAAIELYEHTGQDNYLTIAKNCTDYVFDHFFDDKTKFFFYSQDSQEYIIKNIETEDNVIPSSNAIMCLNLQKMSVLYDNLNYRNTAINMLEIIKTQIDYPSAYSHWLLADLYQSHPAEITLVGKDALKTSLLLRKKVITHTFIFPVEQESKVPYLNKESNNHLLIYLCANNTCYKPEEDLSIITDFQL